MLRLPRSSSQTLELAGAVELPELRVAADRAAVDQDLRNGPPAGELEQALAKGRVVVERDLLVVEAARLEQRLCADAVAAPASRIHLNPGHYKMQTRIPGGRFPPGPD